MRRRAAVLAAALALDLARGEPPAVIHPVVWIGRLTSLLLRRAPAAGPYRQLAYGAAVCGAVLASSTATALALTRIVRPLRAGFLVEVWLLKSMFAVRALIAAAECVRLPLVAGELEGARMALRSLVSRDPRDLDASQVAAAAIESVAENLTDGALAPWLAYAAFGLPGAVAYRALNTLDSMIGYRGHYEYLGKAAARLDDLVNLLPARLGALLLVCAAPLGGGSSLHAARIALRQHRRTASPNAGWTIAAIAGALDRTLAKVGHYRLGDGPPPGAAEIRRAERIVLGALAGGGVIALVLAAVADARRGRGNAGARRTAPGGIARRRRGRARGA